MKTKDRWLPQPQLDLEGNGFIRIENYLGIVEFTDSRLKLKMKDLIYEIHGTCLMVRGVTKREIFLEGKIQGITIFREEKHENQ